MVAGAGQLTSPSRGMTPESVPPQFNLNWQEDMNRQSYDSARRVTFLGDNQGSGGTGSGSSPPNSTSTDNTATTPGVGFNNSQSSYLNTAAEGYKNDYKPTQEPYKPTAEPYKAPGDQYKPTGENYKPPGEQYKTTGDNYKPATPSDYYSTETYKAEPYGKTEGKPDTPETKPGAGYQQSYQNPIRPNNTTPNYPSQNYPTTTPSNYQQNYQQSYQTPKQPPPVQREPSTGNANAPRSNAYPPSNGPALQRQQSSLNTAQRPYQPPSTQPRPAAPPSVQRPSPQPGPRPSSYTPTPSYQSTPASRPSSQTAPSYNQVRPSSTQRPSSNTGSSYVTSTSTYNPPARSSTLNYPSRPESGQWPLNSDSTRTSSGRPFAPTFEEDLIPKFQDGAKDDKMGLQAKFKSLLGKNLRQETSATLQQPITDPPANVAESPSRPLTRTNSEVKILPTVSPLVKKDSNHFDDKLKEELEDDDDDDDDDDEDDIAPKPPDNPLTPTTLKTLGDDGTFDFVRDKEKNSKIDTSVHKNIKFFEQNDKAKVPLVPKSPVFEVRDRPQRPVHIEIVKSTVSIARQERPDSPDSASGVDESPVKHPNLRSIAHPPKKVARISSAGGGSARPRWRDGGSYPGTPTRAVSAPKSVSTPHTPKRTVKPSPRYKPEEELINFFRSPVKKARFFQHTGDEADSNGKENRPTTNGVATPKKTPSRLPGPARRAPGSPTKAPLKSPSTAKYMPKTPDSPAPSTPLIKKVPMNKIQVGSAPSPNLKTVRSKIGSLANTTHKPGGGNIKIESHKMDFSNAQARIANKNDTYAPTGGDKKIATQTKLQWNAKPKVGSLENATYKPGGGEKKIEHVKLDFKEKAKPKVGSKENVKHVPGGGSVKSSANHADPKSQDIESQKLDFKGQSKIGSLDNVKHRPGGGDIKIFDDKTYMKQVSASGSGTQSPMHTSVSKSFSEASQDGS